MKTSLLIFVACVSAASAQREVPWNDLRVKWDVNIFDDTVFQPYPRTQAEAESQGFTQIGSGTCEEGFAGHRYALNGDYSVIVVYDVNGYIAGIQNAISQADAEANSGGFPFEAQPAFRPDNIDGVDYWVLTAYFVDPAQVCVGRTSEEFDEFGTGTGLFIVTGPGAMDYDAIPARQEDAELTEWVYGRCFISMGDHFWYRVSPDLDCNEFFPAFLLYNQGELTGFGWAVQGIYESDHVEYPPSFVLNLFMNPVPTCLPGLVDTIGVTTQHIYFNADLFNVIC